MTETELITYAQQAIDAIKPAAGEVATTVVKNAVWEWIKGKLTGERGKAVEGVEKEPAKQTKWAMLVAQLQEALEEDPALAEELKVLLEEEAPVAGQSVTVHGNENRIAQVQGSNNRTFIR